MKLLKMNKIPSKFGLFKIFIFRKIESFLCQCQYVIDNNNMPNKTFVKKIN